MKNKSLSIFLSLIFMTTLLNGCRSEGLRNKDDEHISVTTTSNNSKSSSSNISFNTSSDRNNSSTSDNMSNISSTSSIISSDSNSSSSDSSSINPDIYIPTVEESVSYIKENYSVYYSITNGEETLQYKNALERISSLKGAEGNLAYYSEYNEYGYYITEDTGYTFYKNGKGFPVYNDNCELEADEISRFEKLVDLNGNFSNAEWKFKSFTNDAYNFWSTDQDVCASATFLTDEQNPVSAVKAAIKKEGSSYKLSGFTTYNEDGDILREAEIKRVGGSMPIDKAPVLSNEIDESLYTKWAILTESGNHVGGYLSAIEVTTDGNLYVYEYNFEESKYILRDIEYSYIHANNLGYYVFKAEGSNVEVMLKVSEGTVMLATYDAETQTAGFDIMVEYYTAWYQIITSQLGYTMEEMTKDDINYPIVEQLKASKGYYVYSSHIDENGNEVLDDMVLVVQYLNREEAVEKYFSGDTKLYNGFVLSGYAFGNLALAAYYSPESVRLVIEISRYVSLEFCDYDKTLYPEVQAGQSALDYVVGHMVESGYSYVTKETANPEFTVNEYVDETDGKTYSTNFYDDINGYMEEYTNIEDSNGEIYNATDCYIFYKENPDEDPEKAGDEYIYAGFMVCDRNMEGYIGGYDNIFVVGYGHFSVTGEILETLMTWKSYQ